jgi:hypothetical protein
MWYVTFSTRGVRRRQPLTQRRFGVELVADSQAVGNGGSSGGSRSISGARPNGSQPPPDPGRAMVYGQYRVQGVGWDFYDRICRGIGFPRTIIPELLGHFAGSTEDGWEVIDFWRDGESMERIFGSHLVDSISNAIAETVPRPDVEPEQREIARLLVGPAAVHYYEVDRESTEDSLARHGLEPFGAMLEYLGGGERDYLEGCARLGVPESLPEGLVLHVAGPCKDGWRVFDCFNSADELRSWHAHVAESIKAVDEEAGRAQTFKYREIKLKRVIVNPALTGGGYLPA